MLLGWELPMQVLRSAGARTVSLTPVTGCSQGKSGPRPRARPSLWRAVALGSDWSGGRRPSQACWLCAGHREDAGPGAARRHSG